MTISGIAASRVEKTENDKGAAYDLDHADKRAHHVGVLNLDIGKAPGTEDSWKTSF